MLINTFLDTEDFVHLYYPDDEPAPASQQGCAAGARLASRYPRPASPPSYTEVVASTSSRGEMTERERCRAPPPPEPPPPLRARAADRYPRARTHYDEPGLDIGFTPICGESVQWAGRTADGGTIAMSNYRLHLQPKRRAGPGVSVPLRLIDCVESCDPLRVVLLCKHGRVLQCTFATGEQCAEWMRRINAALAPLGSVEETFAAAYAAWAKEQPPASVHRALLRASHAPQRHWFGPEVERLGFTSRGAWRITVANADFKLCPSYPPLLVVPATIGDEDLDAVARFRALRRIPAVVWRHAANGAVIARSSQPEVGWFGWRSPEDERLLAAFVAACSADRGQAAPAKQQVKLLVVDARSYASAVTNRARGGGCECQQYYPAADIQFMSLPNIHHVRRSFHAVRAIANDPADQPNWHSALERSLWLQYVGGVLRAGGVAARAVLGGRPVLVHCSDGWDRTPQIVATAQLLLDPHYRTVEGFRTLVEREWLDFGHKFADRCGHQFGPEDPNERSPIFLQWLDVVYQLQQQYPASFQFNEAYLVKLATHVHSCMFGTFLCNTTRERVEARVGEHTAHVWRLLSALHYRNHLYCPADPHVLSPECSVRYLRVWWGLLCGDTLQAPPPPRAQPPAPPPAQPPAKTRSCDNLPAAAAPLVRRASHPSLPVQLSASADEAECRAALTDSCVDALPTHQPAPDQVDGLHPDHFESRARDLASGSSSLERELAPPTPSPAPGPTLLTPHIINDVTLNGDALLPADILDEPGAVDVNLPIDGDTSLPIDGADVNLSVDDVERQEAADDAPDALFLCDTYSDVIGMAEAARASARSRNISITWRSVSESSNQSSGFDITDPRQTRHETTPALNSHDSSPVYLSPAPDLANHNLPLTNHSAPDVELTNHGAPDAALTNHSAPDVALTNHNREPLANGVNGCGELATKFLEVDLSGGATSSSVSSESDADGGEPVPVRRAHGRTRVASQLTLCPASPRRVRVRACCHCDPHSIETSGESGISASSVWCICGHDRQSASCGRCDCSAAALAADPLDGLPPQADRLHQRLHQIILHQKKVVEDLSWQLREARAALRRASPSASLPRASPSAPDQKQMTSSSTGSAGRSGSSSSGSLSEVEVGEEARGVVWLPDSAAPRCQHCRGHFWLARRRHHCRRCGGVFCGSCSEMSSWGDCAVRMCRRCRALR